MRRKTRTKVKRSLVVIGILIFIALIVAGVIVAIKLNEEPEITYEDTLVCKNLFKELIIDYSRNEVKRDGKETTLTEEFDIDKAKADLLFSSEEELDNFLKESVFDIEKEEHIYKIKNHFQTKTLIVSANEIKEEVKGEEIGKIQDNLYILRFTSEKLTQVMYDYYSSADYIDNVFYDEIFIDEPINDISQTMYGQTEVDLKGYRSLGVSEMGLDNYQKIIYENQNPKDIVIATIGYGVDVRNEIFNDRIDDKAYNFMLENQNISATIDQGNRIAEVLVDSTTKNVKILPLVTVTEENYVSVASIVRAICYGIKNSDVICYELIHEKNKAIDMVLERAFRENTPVCNVTSDNEEEYPANHGMTIAVSSLTRENELADYSGKGDFIDFSAPSTDIEEIFKKDSTVSRWSGAQYSNAQIVASIALIKTYYKDSTILDIYNFLRNYCQDLGKEGKDNQYGYGCPRFNQLTIKDIDKDNPEFDEIIFENETWEVLKQITIKAHDNIRMVSWAITESEEVPNEWTQLDFISPNLEVVTPIVKNGQYYIWIQDSAGNITDKMITIDKVDNTPPQIAYTINKDTLESGYVTINVTAEDNESGLYDSPFSWDKILWTQENSKKVVNRNGRYTVYAEDNLGNISEKEIIVDCFPLEGTYQLGDGNIISSIVISTNWDGDTNRNVRITLNHDMTIYGWQISATEGVIPDNFVEVRRGVQETPQTQQQSDVNMILPNNTVLNNGNTSSNTSTDTTTEQQSQTNNNQTNEVVNNDEPVIINATLNANVVYYLWMVDSDGNKSYQSFIIQKEVI